VIIFLQPLSECVDRFLKEALKNIPDSDDEVVKNLEKLFDVPEEGCEEGTASVLTTS